MNKLGIVVGSAPIGAESSLLLKLIYEEDVYTVAADGGIGFFLDNNIEPMEWIGDMDSVGEDYRKKVEVVFPKLTANACSPIKDDTDTAIALRQIFTKGYDRAFVFGGMGGQRSEHSLANIQLMHHYILEGKEVVFYSENSRYCTCVNSTVKYGADEEGFLSVFSLTDRAQVSIKGLFYEYEGELTNSYALGVSNEFCNREASVTVTSGVILIVHTKK